MTVKLSISVPDDVAAYLQSQGNASAAVTEAVRRVLPEAELVCVGSYYPDFRLEKRRWEGTYKHYQGIPILA